MNHTRVHASHLQLIAQSIVRRALPAKSNQSDGDGHHDDDGGDEFIVLFTIKQSYSPSTFLQGKHHTPCTHHAGTGTVAANGGGESALQRMGAAVQMLHSVRSSSVGSAPSTVASSPRVPALGDRFLRTAHSHARTSALGNLAAVSEGSADVLPEMEEIEISLRSISHDFMALFVEAEAQAHLLAHASEQQQVLLQQLQRAETHIEELEEDVAGAKGSLESLRAENLSLRRRNEELLVLKDASSIPKVCRLCHAVLQKFELLYLLVMP